jgi:succinate-acetate transporter protein
MNVSFNLGALAKTKWYEYLVRFAFGGAITVIAGILAKHFGPVFGGLFLAFPAIFPASATLVAKHETEKKQKAGFATSCRGRQAAALDAAGAALGSVGLAGFALTFCKLLPRYNSAFVFLAATAVWLALAILSWRIWNKHLCR